MTSRPDRLTLIAFVMIVVLAGANAVAVRFTVAELPPFWGAALRFTSAALIFSIIVLSRRIPIPRGRSFWGILLYGILGFGGSYAFIYWGIRTIPAGLVQVILALVPLLTFLLAFAHRLELFRWRTIMGSFLAAAGIGFAFFEQPGSNFPLASLAAVLAGAVCIAESTVVLKMFPGVDPFATNALAMAAGAFLLFILSLVAHESRILPVQTRTWESLAYLVLIGSVVVFYLFIYVLKHWTASATSYQFVLFPFITVVLASRLAGERVNSAFILGGLLALAGVWIGAFSGARIPAGVRGQAKADTGSQPERHRE